MYPQRDSSPYGSVNYLAAPADSNWRRLVESLSSRCSLQSDNMQLRLITSSLYDDAKLHCC